MVIWFLIILVVALVGVKVCRRGFFQDFLGKEQCNAIKGVFILLVFLGHALASVRDSGFIAERALDDWAFSIWGELGQLVVVMFLFYSGYGVMTSLLTRGEKYLDSYPKRRLLTTLVNFDVAVFCFLVLSLILGSKFSVPKVALSLIGWESLGNSNWYIFVILFCYLAFYLVFRIVRSNYLVGAILVAVLVFAGMLVLHDVKVDPYWYNTILVFPVGVFFALYADKFSRYIQERYWISLALLIAVFLFLHLGNFRSFHGLTFNLKGIVFSILIIVLTMKIKIGNRWLIWCGFSLFPLYIYQRLPMNAIRGISEEWVCVNPNAFIGICFVLTLGITVLFNKYFRIQMR